MKILNSVKVIRINLDNCPFGCSQCDNYNGCISCQKGRILHNNNCLSYCPPQLKDLYPNQCAVQVQKCTPKITIMDKMSYHIIDGSNFKISVNTTNCPGKFNIQWETNLPKGSYITLDDHRTLIVNRKNMIIPKTYSFKVLLYKNDEVVESDSYDVDFIKVISINSVCYKWW
jgi:hypothetical protein